mgnify:CR=1 FL=1
MTVPDPRLAAAPDTPIVPPIMAIDLPKHREKMREMFAFWGWDVRDQDVRLTWYEMGDLELAVWVIFRRDGGKMQREWVISEPTGILPIDHLSADKLPNARSALNAFASLWKRTASESLVAKVGPERAAWLRANKPDVLAQNEQMLQMIGLAAELMADCANEME